MSGWRVISVRVISANIQKITWRNCIEGKPPTLVFLQLMIIKELKVFCFNTLLQLLILKELQRNISDRNSWKILSVLPAAKRKCGNRVAARRAGLDKSTAKYSRKQLPVQRKTVRKTSVDLDRRPEGGRA